MGSVFRSSHVVSAAPASSWGGLLTLCPGSSLGSLPHETILHGLFQCEPFPQAAVLHDLLQDGSFPWGALLQEQICLVWVPHGVTSPAKSLLQCGLLSPWIHRSCQEPAPAQVFHRVTGTSTCSGVGSSLGCRWITSPLWTSMACSRTACLTMVCSMGCRGISAPAPGAPPTCPSSPTLVFAGLFLSHSLTILSGCKMPLCRVFSFLKYLVTEMLPPSLMGLA